MAVPEQMPIVAYIANGTTFSFPITFDLHDERYLDVLINKELAKSTSYTIENNSAVVFGTAPRSGDEIILARSTTLDRQTNFDSYNNSFRPSALNWDLDKIWHTLQEQYVVDANFLARLKNELETRRTSDSLLQHQIDILNSVLLGVFENASSTYLEVKLQELEDSLDNAINIAAAAGAGENGWTDLLIKTEDGSTQRDINERSLKNGEYAPLLGSPVKLKLNPIMASFLYGISDPTHKDDDLNNFRGLNNPDAWHDSNIAIGGFAVGRNNVPFAYLGNALGHDCIAYGVASLVGGAGSCTGNPDVPNDGATYGYCGFVWGKNSQGPGRISNAMGERCISGSRYSSTDGYKCIAGKVLPSHPDYNIHGGEGEEGAAARAHGYESEAYGNFAFAYGSFLKAYNGAQVIGKGVSSSLRGLAMGYGVDRPTLFLEDGATRGETRFGWVGFNTNQPLSKYDWRLQQSDTLSYTIDAQGSPDTLVAFEVKGLLGNGSYGSLHNVIVTHPNSGQPYGIVQYRLNGTEYLTVDQTRKAKFSNAVEAGSEGFLVAGKRVVGGQLSAILNASGSDIASVNSKLNEILIALRAHGLIAT